MPANLNHFLLSGLLLVATTATAAGQVIYKWKDSGGIVHYTDTPPPAGATLLNEPRSVPVFERATGSTPERDDKPMLREPCRPDISAAECDAVRRSLQADLDDLARNYGEVGDDKKDAVSDDEANRRDAALRERECSESRNALGHLRDRQTGKSTEVLTAEERASVPAQIADVERAIASSCN